MLRVATRRTLLSRQQATSSLVYPITFTTTKNGSVVFNLTKTGETPSWFAGDGYSVVAEDFSHTYNGGTYDGFAYWSDAGGLSALYCQNNNLTKLSIGDGSGLGGLYCYGNDLTKLDVSAIASLLSLNCVDNDIDELDISLSTGLVSLYCHINNLDVLDASANVNLTDLTCYSNGMTTLIISGCVVLASINCSNNNLDDLDVSTNVSLAVLYCQSNSFSQAVVDQVLADMNSHGTSNVTINIAGTNAAPSAAGLGDKADIESRGGTVTVSA